MVRDCADVSSLGPDDDLHALDCQLRVPPDGNDGNPDDAPPAATSGCGAGATPAGGPAALILAGILGRRRRAGSAASR